MANNSAFAHRASSQSPSTRTNATNTMLPTYHYGSVNSSSASSFSSSSSSSYESSDLFESIPFTRRQAVRSVPGFLNPHFWRSHYMDDFEHDVRGDESLYRTDGLMKCVVILTILLVIVLVVFTIRVCMEHVE